MPAISIQDIRQKYPQYNDVSDQELADKLYKKHYSDMPKEAFYQKIGYSNKEAESSELKNKINQFKKEQLEDIHRTPFDKVRDIAVGFGNAGQNLAKFLTRGRAPQVDMARLFGPQNPTATDNFVQGAAQYAPFAAAGGAGLVGSTLASAAYGATQSEDPAKGAVIDALVNAGTHGLVKGVDALRPSKLLRGNLSEEELAKNLEAAKGTNTGLGDVIGSPTLKKTYENVLTKIPFSGAVDSLQKSAETVQDTGKSILYNLLGKNNPSTANEDLGKALILTAKKHTNDKNLLYKEANQIADDHGLELDLQSFADNAKKYSDAIETTNILKYEPDVRKLFNKLQNYIEPVKSEKGLLIDKSGNPSSVTKTYPRLEEANLLKGKLNNYEQAFRLSPDPEKRGLASVFRKLASSLKSDINTAIDKSGNSALKSAYDTAEENYAKNFSPFLDKEIYKFTNGNADPDLLTQNFVKNSRSSDRANQVAKLTDKLSPKGKKLLGYSYLSKALDKEGNLNPSILNQQIKNLGKNQFKELFDAEVQKALLNYQRLYKMNAEGTSLMANPKTGQRNSDLMSFMAGILGGASGMGTLGGTIAGARTAVKGLTSESVRESLVKAILENKSKSLNPRYLQTLGQTLANQNQ